MTDGVSHINSAKHDHRAIVPLAPSRVEQTVDATLQQKGISSVIEHRDPGFFNTRIFTLFPLLAESHEAHTFPFPDLDSLLEAHLRKRWEAEWDTFGPEKQLKYKRALAGSARNWDDLIYQVVLENLDQFQGLTPTQKERLRRAPLIREEFCHNSPLNGQSYLTADGTYTHRDSKIGNFAKPSASDFLPSKQAISAGDMANGEGRKDGDAGAGKKPIFESRCVHLNLTHAGSCSEDRASEATHLFRRVSYNENGETLYYTGRSDTHTKAIEQAKWIFRHEQGPQGKGITSNADGSVTLTYLINSMVDTGYWENLDSEDVKEFLRQEVATLRTLRGQTITIDDSQVRLNPILVHEQYNSGATAEKCMPAWFSGKKSSDKIMSENLPLLEDYALQVKQALQESYSTASLKEQPEILKKIRYIDLALQKLGNYDALPPDERVFYFALLARMLNIPFIVHCKSSKDHTGSAGKLIAALYTWLDVGMPDDFSRIIGNKSSKNDPLRKLFDELVTGHLMAAHQVSRYGIGASGVIEGEQLEADRMGLDIGGTPPTVDHLPDRYTKPTPILFCAKAFLFFIGALILEVFGIIGAIVEFIFSTIFPILFILWFVKYRNESEKFWDHYLYICSNVFLTLPKDIFRIFCSCVATPTRGIDKASPYVQAHTLLKPKPSIQMANEAQKLLRSIDELKQDSYGALLTYLKQDAPELADDTLHRETLVNLGRALPLLSRVAKRSDFAISAKARTLIEAFEASKTTEWDQIEYLSERELRHLQDFMLDDKRGKEEILSPRAQIVYKYLTNDDAPLKRAEPTERERRLFQTLAQSSCSNYSLCRVNFIEEATYNHIIAYFQNANDTLAALTLDEQKVALILLENIKRFRTSAQKNLSVKESTIVQFLTDDKIVKILLEKIDILSNEDFDKMVAFLKHEYSENAYISDRVLKLLFQHLKLIFSKANKLSERQRTILENLAAAPLSSYPFSIDHITHLNDAQYTRLLAHFQSKDPVPATLSSTDQKLLNYVVLGSEKLFEQEQLSMLSDKQRNFLQALALAPYGKFTLARLQFLPNSFDNLPPLAKQVFVRDLDAMSYETHCVTPNTTQIELLNQGKQNISIFIGALIDTLTEQETSKLLKAIGQPNPNAGAFTAAQKRLLLLLANHSGTIDLKTPRYQALIQACKNSPLFLFQVHRLAAHDSVQASVDKLSSAETLADWAYTVAQDHEVKSLDGKTTFIVGNQFHKDIHRNQNLQFSVGSASIPNASDKPFTLSNEFLQTSEGALFLQRLQEELNTHSIEKLYDPLVQVLPQMPLSDLMMLIKEQHPTIIKKLHNLDTPCTATQFSQLSELLEKLRESLFVDLLFNSLKTLTPLSRMEQLPPLLQDCISQSGRNYGTGRLLEQHLICGMSQQPTLHKMPGSLWRISFNAVDQDTLTVDFAADFNLISLTLNRSFGKIIVDYRQHCTKDANSLLWTSRLEVPQELKLIFSPILEDDRDLLFTAFTSPQPDTIVSVPDLIKHLKNCIEDSNHRIPTLSPNLQAYFVQRMKKNLAVLKPLITDADYETYITELRYNELPL